MPSAFCFLPLIPRGVRDGRLHSQAPGVNTEAPRGQAQGHRTMKRSQDPLSSKQLPRPSPLCSACTSRQKPPPRARASCPPVSHGDTATPSPSPAPTWLSVEGGRWRQGRATSPVLCACQAVCSHQDGVSDEQNAGPASGCSRVSAHSKPACFYFSVCKHRRLMR